MRPARPRTTSFCAPATARLQASGGAEKKRVICARSGTSDAYPSYRANSAGVPGLPTGRVLLLPVFTGPGARAPARCVPRGGAPPSSHRRWRGPGIGSAKALGGRPGASQMPCAAPRLVPRVAQQRTGRHAGPRHGATLRLSGAAHQRAQRTRLSGADRAARTASTAGPLANAATVTGRHRPPGGPGGDQVARVGTDEGREFAQVTG